VMELLDDTPGTALRRRGAAPSTGRCRSWRRSPRPSDAAHEQDPPPRPKPGNVLLCGGDGDRTQVKVLDFGLAAIAGPHSFTVSTEEPAPKAEAGKLDSGKLTAEGDLVGTPHYVAPEVIRHLGASRASDLYSFAATAYELLAGRPPFQGSVVEILTSSRRGARPLPEAKGRRHRPAAGVAGDPAPPPGNRRRPARDLWAAADGDRLVQWRRRRAAVSSRRAASVLAAGLLLPSPASLLRALGLRPPVVSAPERLPDPGSCRDPTKRAPAESPCAAGGPGGRGPRGSTDRCRGVRGVAIDLLLPQRWGAAPEFSDLVLRHPQELTLAAHSAANRKVVGTSGVAGLTTAALGPQAAAALFGFVSLDEDPDGVVRRSRLHFRDAEGGTRLSWAAHAAAALAPLPKLPTAGKFWIDHRIDPSRYAKVPEGRGQGARTRSFDSTAAWCSSVATTRATTRTASPPERPAGRSGLALQALLVDTLVSGLPVRGAQRWPFLAGAVLWAAPRRPSPRSRAGPSFRLRSGGAPAGLRPVVLVSPAHGPALAGDPDSGPAACRLGPGPAFRRAPPTFLLETRAVTAILQALVVGLRSLPSSRSAGTAPLRPRRWPSPGFAGGHRPGFAGGHRPGFAGGHRLLPVGSASLDVPRRAATACDFSRVRPRARPRGRERPRLASRL
jgi:hypothetical protein